MKEFGVVICCCKLDYFLAKACCASVRYFLGDIPITLFIDGEFDARSFARAYNIQLLYRSEIKNDFLRECNRGWGLPKMTLFWESPYERYLYLDCDTIIWGDVLKAHLGGYDWDMTIDFGEPNSRECVDHDYFDIKLMESHFPEFPWEKYRDCYFCTGTFAARRGAFRIEDYQSIIETTTLMPGLFHSGEMGFLNFMIFQAFENQKLALVRTSLELMCDFRNYQTLPERLVIGQDGPLVRQDDARILHFTDPKPLTSSYGFNEPVSYFRKEALKKTHGITGALADRYLQLEEIRWRATIYYRRNFGKYHVKLKKLLKR